jgi:hypothetical protein
MRASTQSRASCESWGSRHVKENDPTGAGAGGVAGRELIRSAFADWRETYGALSSRMHCLTPPGYS